MTKNFMSKYYAFFIAAIVLFTDQTVKSLISSNMLLNENIPVLNNIVSLTKTYNTGAAFGIFQDGTRFLSVFSILAIVLMCVYVIKNYKSLNLLGIVAWGLVLGGTIGNFVDRLSLGYVLDFIRLDFVNFPIFNIADLSINCGAALLIIYIIFASKGSEHQKELKQ